jgi:hypothetical protein
MIDEKEQEFEIVMVARPELPATGVANCDIYHQALR